MKTSLLYGCILTLASALFTLVMYFVGAHSDPEKMNSTALIGLLFYVVIGFTVIFLGMRARRAELPADQGFSYGQALGTGVLIALVAAVTGTIFQYLYENFINTNFVEVQNQAQALKMAAKGMSDAMIEKNQAMMKKFSSPLIRSGFTLVFIFIFTFIYSLVAAAFNTRRDPNEATTL